MPENKKEVIQEVAQNQLRFKEGAIPDFGEEKLVFKNGEIKLNSLSAFDKIEFLTLKTEKRKDEFLNKKARELTAHFAADYFMEYCKKIGLTVGEMKLVLQVLEYKHQLVVKKALDSTTICD